MENKQHLRFVYLFIFSDTIKPFFTSQSSDLLTQQREAKQQLFDHIRTHWASYMKTELQGLLISSTLDYDSDDPTFADGFTVRAAVKHSGYSSLTWDIGSPDKSCCDMFGLDWMEDDMGLFFYDEWWECAGRVMNRAGSDFLHFGFSSEEVDELARIPAMWGPGGFYKQPPTTLLSAK